VADREAAHLVSARELLVGASLRRDAGGRRILDVERIAVHEGELLAVLGPNGAGKSTLLLTLALLEPPTTGSVRVGDLQGPAAERALRERSAFVFQRPHMWDGTVRWNLELGLRLRGRSREGVEAMAASLGLEPLLEARARTLSAGEAQRVALGRALLLAPEVLFLDEPTANLDAEARNAIRENLDRVARTRARSVVLATHERSEAFYLADRVAVLREGRIVQVGRPSELFENPADPFIAGVTGAELSLRGRVEAADGEVLGVLVEGVRLTAVGRAGVGSSVRMKYRPEDLLLSNEEPSGSARNRIRSRVREIRSLGGLVRVRLDGPPELAAVVTRASAAELGLAEGREVWVQVKATALHAFET
jgi:tungstate transport system ATP-binding protein